jgi:hypothetical protein
LPAGNPADEMPAQEEEELLLSAEVASGGILR